VSSADLPPGLFDFAGKHLRHVRDLTSTEWADYRRAVYSLGDFQSARMLLPMVQASLTDFLAAMQSAEGTVTKSGLLREGARQIDFETNRRFLSFLSAVRTYLDHTETRLKRQYGDGEPFDSFKQACKNAYDGSFAYRFLYKLRDYSQHCGLPIGHVVVTASRSTPAGPDLKRVVLGFDAGDLLARGGDTWGAVVRRELAAMPTILDIEPILEEVALHLQRIDEATCTAERPFLTEAARPVIDLLSPIARSGGAPVAGILHPTEKGADVELIQAPSEALRWIGLEYLSIEV